MIFYRDKPTESIMTHHTEWFWEGASFTLMKTLYYPGHVADDDEDMNVIYIELVWGMVKT